MSEKKLEKERHYKIPFWSFVSMLFLTVYSLQNGEQIYYQMGYASITYLIIAAIFYFIPFCFIIAEMSSAFRKKTGGIYSWMEESVGEKFSFIGTFIWYGAAVIVWFGASSICIAISVVLFGKDLTSTWAFLGLSSPQIVAIIGIIYMIIAGWVSTRGVKRITFLSNIAMITIILTHILIIGGAFVVFAMSGFHFAQGFDFGSVHSYFFGPNKQYASLLPAIAFLVFTVFIYAGIENVSGMVDKVKDSKKNVPKAIALSCVIITILYILIVLVSGMVCNWKKTFGSPDVNLYNFSIYLVQEQFYRFGTLLGMAPHDAVLLGQWVNRFLTLLNLLFLLAIPLKIYAPIKTMFEGLPKGLMPRRIVKLNKHGVSGNAILIQTVIVCIFIFLLGFGGKSVSSMYNKIVLMTVVAGSIPYSFIIFAYIKFKLNNNIQKEYQFFSKKVGVIYAILCFVLVTFANIFSVIEPALTGDYMNTIWIGGGPVLFALIAYVLYARYESKKKKLINEKNNIEKQNLSA